MGKTVERPRTADKNDPRYFSIKTRAVKAFKKDGVGGQPDQYFIEGTASSSVEDRYGDTLTDDCQRSMLAQANGLTMWLNHSYDVPEDIAGTCVAPTLSHASAEDGSQCLDLNIKLEIDPENPRAMKSWQHVNRGTKLAFSIGGYFTDFDFVDEDDWWFSPLIVNDIDLLEISLVGIPANPRAYTKAFEVATEALRAEVVKRAEQIVKDGAKPRDARMLVRKSFGLAGKDDSMEPHVKTGDLEQTGTTDQPAAEVVNPPADPIENSDPPEGGAPATAGADVPADEAATLAAEIEALVRKHAPVGDEATVRSQVTALTTERTTLSADVERLKTEKADLEQEITRLKATPTGRFTQSSAGGSSKGSEPTVTAEMYQRSKSEMSEAASRSMGKGAPTDARQTLQVTT